MMSAREPETSAGKTKWSPEVHAEFVKKVLKDKAIWLQHGLDS